MRTLCRRFLEDERGLETIEYAIVAGLIVVGTVAAFAVLGDWVKTKFEDLGDALKSQ